MTLIIQIAISVIVVFLVFSVMVFTIVEWLTTLIQLRGKKLKDAILKLFNDKQEKGSIGEMLYKHPQIEKLFRGGKKLPSYIPANNVAVALIDIIKVDKASLPGELSEELERYQQYKEGLLKLPGGDLKKLMLSITGHTNSLDSLTRSIEKWYNDYMDRVSGWYKIHIRNIVLVVAGLVTIAFNIDTIHVIRVSATDKDTRDRMNILADQLVRDSMINTVVMRQENNQDYYEDYVNDDSFDGKDSLEKVQQRDSLIAAANNESMERLIKLNQMVHEWQLPVGWGIKKTQAWYYVLLGWILSTLALSAGAPFWFDLLKKLVNVRNTGAKPLVPGRPNEQ
jgi:hypothetical protein